MYYLGIDLGGTRIKAGIVDETGRILSKNSVPTRYQPGAETVVADMLALGEQLVEAQGFSIADLAGVGVGVPGAVHPKTGMVLRCVNLGWERVPLSEMLGKAFSLSVRADNDANVAAVAEAAAGVSLGVENSVFLTLGTGVGSGIIVNGRLISGVHGAGAEIGHTVIEAGGVPCTCGKSGCVDRYCSAVSFVRMAKEAMERHPGGLLEQRELNPEAILACAEQGDPAAAEAFDRYTTYLAVTISNIVHTLDPQVVVLGGGVSGAGEQLLAPVREKLDRLVMYHDLPYAELKIASLGNDAGIIGAAMLLREGVSA